MNATYSPANVRGRSETGSPFTGVGTLARLIVRQDRVRISVWILSVLAFCVYFLVVLTNLFDAEALAGRAEVLRTPAGIVMGGPGYGLENYTAPVAVANEGMVWIILALSMMSIFHVVRHTRAQEENGLAELVRASSVGKHAAAGATMLTLAGILLAGTVLITLAMVAAVPGTSIANTFALLLGSAMVAFVFGAIALAICQITAHSRTATGMGMMVFGAAFAIRAAGDIQQQGGSLLSWISPIAWAQQTRPFVDLRLWPLLLPVVTTSLLLFLAAELSARRDFDAGLISGKPGPSTAASSLNSPLNMAWLQQRGALLWSCIGLGAMWFGTGTMMSTIDEMMSDLIETNPTLGQLFGTDPSVFAASFLDVMVMFAALCCAGYAVVMGQRPRAEEADGRLEMVLATPVSRSRWIVSQMAVAALGTLVLLAFSILATWAGATLVGVTDPGLGNYATAFIAYAPTTMIYLMLAMSLFVWTPRFMGVAWALVAYTFIVGMFGAMLELPGWAMNISPLHAASTAFTTGVSSVGIWVFTALSLLLATGAIVGFQKREVPTI